MTAESLLAECRALLAGAWRDLVAAKKALRDV